ncbi:hypothetical protein LuPra_00505 [Luteitalea pratensis]|uniref:DUF3426 domain-containing protein n=1 Tax=Luteitalea pratensis TaxID=1855912 RepID=A0A143PGZ2_LUTPR|nr:hypothetical protein [Luteitalea pratensis]AMY07338.1 hypothetical protein LuPra_00505 [Luteitalea pratensis]
MLFVTIAALVMAASLGWFAYRLLRDEQRRADARVALLTAAIDGDDTSGWDPPARAGHVGFVSARAARPPLPAPAPTPVVAGASAVPAVPELIFLEDEPTSGRDFVSERSDWMRAASGPTARASAASTRSDGSDANDDFGSVDATSPRPAGLFGEAPEPQRRSGFAIVMLGALLAALLAVAYTWFTSDTPAPAAARATSSAQATAPATGGMPLELLSLAHEQHKGALVVRGIVRNPVSGSDRVDVVASVMLLDTAGGVLGSGRAPLRATQLRPGQETAFAVELPSHADVRRYRVTFRAPDGSLVAHADRRTRASSTSS